MEVEKKMGELGLTVVAAWIAEWGQQPAAVWHTGTEDERDGINGRPGWRRWQLGGRRCIEEDHRSGSRKVAEERLRDVKTRAAKEVEDGLRL
ncbi:hypothetical protein AMTR_s00018p00249030 [Amborella trichopoda]|uniref:Uncharacterized protein n=1 Tax=Amborella trichopoda TaxID=13333 RepID=W1PE93_AMBTC|nr:hypothetical protein AMTR_s00018p00249030 [Amborella trichopoda]